jgi:large subunit ribosomal protein L31
MKKEIHPNYKELKIRIGNDTFNTMSTHPSAEILMDIDFRKHPAWTGKGVTSADQSNHTINAFNQRFSGLNLGTKA